MKKEVLDATVTSSTLTAGDLKTSDEKPSRFKACTSSSELDKLSGKQFSENTDRKISWAVELF